MHGYYLIHYGVGAEDNPPGRGSGRYPLGSGERPYQDKEVRKKKIYQIAKAGAAIGVGLIGAKIAYDRLWNTKFYKLNVRFPMANLNKVVREYATDIGLNEVKGGYTIGLDYLKKARLLYA